MYKETYKGAHKRICKNITDKGHFIGTPAQTALFRQL